MSIFQQL